LQEQQQDDGKPRGGQQRPQTMQSQFNRPGEFFEQQREVGHRHDNKEKNRALRGASEVTKQKTGKEQFRPNPAPCEQLQENASPSIR